MLAIVAISCAAGAAVYVQLDSIEATRQHNQRHLNHLDILHREERALSELRTVAATGIAEHTSAQSVLNSTIARLSEYVAGLATEIPSDDPVHDGLQRIESQLDATKSEVSAITSSGRDPGPGGDTGTAYQESVSSLAESLEDSLHWAMAVELGRLERAQLEQQRAARRGLIFLAGMGIFWLATMAVLGGITHSLFARPLRKVSASARAMAAGASNVRAPTPPLKELGEVGAAINFLTDSLTERSREVEEYLSRNLERRTEELEQANAGLREEVAERERAEVALRANETKLRQAQRVARLGYWESHAPFSSIQWSAGLEEVLGLPPAFEASSNELFARIHPEDRESVQSQVELAILRAEPLSVQFRVLHDGGRLSTVFVRAEVMLTPEGQPDRIFGTAQDVTEEAETQRILGESQASLKAFFDATDEALILLDTNLRAKAFNPAGTTFAREVLAIDLEAGGVIAGGLSGTMGEEALASAQRAVGGERVEFEYEFVDPVAKPRWFHVSCSPVRPDDVDVAGVAFIATEITARRMAEEQLIQAQKMESIGRLAGGVAHDFNNLLSVIIGYGQLAAASLAEDQPARQDIDEVLNASNKAAALIRQLLAFARRQHVEPRDVDVNELILNLAKLLKRLIGEDIELACVTEHTALTVRIDPGQFEQVIVNMAVNARDAMPNGGRLTISTQTVRFGRAHRGLPEAIPAGDYALVVIADAGTGMSQEVADQIFEPFYTTKEQGKGTGLGLSTCYGIVKQAGGHISVESQPGYGTTFKVYLPLLGPETSASNEAAATLQSSAAGSECILLVEDEDAVRALAERVLRSQGYRVLSAAGPVEALDLAATEQSIDLILSDVVMPVMDGATLTEVLTAIFGPTPILLMSGHAEESAAATRMRSQGIEMLEKPFSPEALAARVRGVIDCWAGSPTRQSAPRAAAR